MVDRIMKIPNNNLDKKYIKSEDGREEANA